MSVTKYTLTWTEQVVANGVADDDATIMDFANCISYYAEWDTVGATTGAPNFDFHLVSSTDAVNYINTASHTTLAAAVAKNVRDADTKIGADIPLGSVKGLLDVNGANLAATEFVVLRLVLLNQY